MNREKNICRKERRKKEQTLLNDAREGEEEEQQQQRSEGLARAASRHAFLSIRQSARTAMDREISTVSHTFDIGRSINQLIN